MSMSKKVGLIILPLLCIIIYELLWKIGILESLFTLLGIVGLSALDIILVRLISLLFNLVLPLILVLVFNKIKYVKMIGMILIGSSLLAFIFVAITDVYHLYSWDNFKWINVLFYGVLLVLEVTGFVFMILVYRSLSNDFAKKGLLGVIILSVFLVLVSVMNLVPDVYEMLFENVVWLYVSKFIGYTLHPFIVFLGLKELGEF